MEYKGHHVSYFILLTNRPPALFIMFRTLSVYESINSSTFDERAAAVYTCTDRSKLFPYICADLTYVIHDEQRLGNVQVNQ